MQLYLLLTKMTYKLSSLRSNSFNADRNIDKCNYTLWKGQLLNKGKLLCYISLRSSTQAFLPIKLPEKLDVETVMSIDHLKQKIPPALFYKETYLGPNEVLKNGMYCSLYEVVEKPRIGNNLESLLQKLEKEKLAENTSLWCSPGTRAILPEHAWRQRFLPLLRPPTSSTDLSFSYWK
ncbi:protein TASOR-like isoform X3 [Dipodomys spectabilis]|uniref:protein TASOR-like isoform X3 n=1 Tax=Dipodomys spectabilis TaxID=105255 RepID=UPI001C53A1FA|nr:protein TASOR-like isoform X3 [Dipodomys spectabilis]XP_042535971.1 protein TASOR-like isoform X3 [Dipodomys spectabilis]XP_042535972.1 protein TASOR-like isoform X3 [Dipodomys spectabilis]